MADTGEPLDLGETDLSPEEVRRARAEHDLDDPQAFDERTGIDERAPERAELLPEEQAVHSDDPEAQAREVLRDSEVRTEVAGSAPDTFTEHRRSEDTV